MVTRPYSVRLDVAAAGLRITEPIDYLLPHFVSSSSINWFVTVSDIHEAIGFYQRRSALVYVCPLRGSQPT